jgi:hypothetical protein
LFGYRWCVVISFCRLLSLSLPIRVRMVHFIMVPDTRQPEHAKVIIHRIIRNKCIYILPKKFT